MPLQGDVLEAELEESSLLELRRRRHSEGVLVLFCHDQFACKASCVSMLHSVLWGGDVGVCG